MTSLDTLIDHLRSGTPLERHQAYAFLPSLTDAHLVPALVQTLHQGDSEARWRAAQLLGWLGDPAAVEPLITALSDAEWTVRYSAVWALAMLVHPRGMDALYDTFYSSRSEEQVRYVAARGLLAGGADDPLYQALEQSDELLWRPAHATFATQREKSTATL